MCNHPNREAAMVVINDNVWCDPCLTHIIRILNNNDLPTVASCCGHGKRLPTIALADGRELFIAPNYEEARRVQEYLITNENHSQ